MQRLRDQRVGVDESADDRVGSGGCDSIAYLAVDHGVRRCEKRDDDGACRAFGPVLRGFGQYRMNVRRVAGSGSVYAGDPYVHRGVVDPNHRGQVSDRAIREIGVSGDQILYVGDHLYADVHV